MAATKRPAAKKAPARRSRSKAAALPAPGSAEHYRQFMARETRGQVESQAIAKLFSDDDSSASESGIVRPSNPTRQIPTLFRGLALISETIGAAPPMIWDLDADEPVVGGELVEFFDEPSPGQGWSEWCNSFVAKYHTGHVGLLPWPLNSVGEGKLPEDLRLLSKGEFAPFRKTDRAGGKLSFDQKHRIDGWKVDGLAGIVPTEDIRRVVYHSDAWNKFGSVSPWESANLNIDVEWMALEFQRSVLARGGTAGTILSRKPDAVSLGAPFDDEERRKYEAEWRRRIGGVRNGAGTVFVDEDINVQMLGRPPKDMEYTELRKFWITLSAIILNLPPIYLAHFEGIGWGTEGVLQMKSQAWEMNFMPLLQKLARALTLSIVRPYNSRWEFLFNLDQIEALRDDLNKKLDAALKYQQLLVPLAQTNELLDLGIDTSKILHANEAFLPNGTPVSVVLEGSALPPPDVDQLTAEVEAEGAAPAAPVEAAVVEPPLVDKSVALNGAQISAAASLVVSIITGELPKDTVAGLLAIGFNLSAEQVAQVIGSAKPKPQAQLDREAMRGALERHIEQLNLRVVVGMRGAGGGGGGGAIPATAARARPAKPSMRRRTQIKREWLGDRAKVMRKIDKRLTESLSKARADVIKQVIRLHRQRAGLRAISDVNLRDPVRLNGQDAVDIAASIVDEVIMAPIGETVREAYIAGTKSVESILAEDMGVAVADLFAYQAERVPQLSLEYHAGRMASAGTNMPTRLREKVGVQILEGLKGGDNLGNMTKRLRTVFDVAKKDADRIARTEAQIAMGRARDDMMKAQGIEHHMWLGGARDSHAANDGQVRAVGEPFDNGQHYAGDESVGDPAEFINCECTMVPLTRRQSVEQREAS